MTIKQKEILERLSFFGLILVAFSIAQPIRINSIVSVSALGLCLFHIASSRKFDLTFFITPMFVLVMTQAVILIFGLIHTSDLSQGYADIERYGYAILFPFLIYEMRNSGINILKL